MPNIIEWPRAWWGVAAAEFYLTPRSQRSQSPWTMRQNIYGPHVQYWQARLIFPTLLDGDLAARESIIEQLGGTAGLLRMGHPFRITPMFSDEAITGIVGWSDGTFFTDGTGWLSGPLPSSIHVYSPAAARTTSVVVGGLPINTSRVLRRGDMVEFRRDGIADETPSLHRVLVDAHSNANGRCSISFLPPLRKAVAAGDQVVLDYPTTVFRLAGDEPQASVRNAAWHGSLEMNLVEALI